MLLPVLNAGAVPQTEIVRGQETPTDVSGTIAETGAWQTLAGANETRSGLVMQNVGQNAMDICEMTQPDDPTRPAASQFWNVSPGGYWPPPGFPTTTGPVLVRGTQGDAWAARDY